jgi:hypothetical protein
MPAPPPPSSPMWKWQVRAPQQQLGLSRLPCPAALQPCAHLARPPASARSRSNRPLRRARLAPQVLHLVNEARASLGLPRVCLSIKLSEAAEAFGTDYVENASPVYTAIRQPSASKTLAYFEAAGYAFSERQAAYSTQLFSMYVAEGPGSATPDNYWLMPGTTQPDRIAVAAGITGRWGLELLPRAQAACGRLHASGCIRRGWTCLQASC